MVSHYIYEIKKKEICHYLFLEMGSDGYPQA